MGEDVMLSAKVGDVVVARRTVVLNAVNVPQKNLGCVQRLIVALETHNIVVVTPNRIVPNLVVYALVILHIHGPNFIVQYSSNKKETLFLYIRNNREKIFLHKNNSYILRH